jgi:hypothetical protein
VKKSITKKHVFVETVVKDIIPFSNFMGDVKIPKFQKFQKFSPVNPLGLIVKEPQSINSRL